MPATPHLRPLHPQPAPPEPARLRLARRVDGELTLARAGELPRVVRPVPCFPWAQPARFISLREPDGDELALIENPDELSPASRAVLEAALAEHGFVLRIERVHEVGEEIEIRTWRVTTAQGERSFQTARDQWPRALPGGGLLVRDVAGDLYFIADPRALDSRSRAAMWAFIDLDA